MASSNAGDSCDVCEEVLANNPVPEKTTLSIDVDVSVINKPHPDLIKEHQKVWKKDRGRFLLLLKKKLCALRNSGGGALFVHINGLDERDHDLDYFHELVDVRLNDMIEDGSLFVDVYKKAWLGESGNFHNILSITVTGSSQLVTLDYKTKTPLDNSINDSTTLTVHKLVKDSKTTKITEPTLRGIRRTTGESRTVQAKTLTLAKDKQQRLLQSESDFVQHVWQNLKLPFYITSFTKVEEGGSFYVGIEEKQAIYERYKSRLLSVKGFRYDKKHHQHVVDELKEKVAKELIVLVVKPGSAEFSVPQNLIEVKFHPVQENEQQLHVLEVAVAPVDGIVFYDKEGPEAYEIKDGTCARIKRTEWCRRFRECGRSVNHGQAGQKEIYKVPIRSLYQNLPTIRQIGSSINEIKNHVIKETALSIYPRNCVQETIKGKLSEQVQQLTSSGLVYMSDNLSVSANLETICKPNEVLFDVFLAVSNSPPAVLSIVKEEYRNVQHVQDYNLSLARAIISAVRLFVDEPFSAVYGVITDTQLDSKEVFMEAIADIENRIARYCVPRTLELPDSKRENVIVAFLSSVAMTTSVDVMDNSRWFLTLEQFVILTENIDRSEVTLRNSPRTGDKVLMREIARRLERSGPTLLVMESEKQLQAARDMAICSMMLTVDEWRSAVAKKQHPYELTNMVTNCQDCPNSSDITGRTWTFLPDDEREEREETRDTTYPSQKPVNISLTTEIPAEKLTDTISKLQSELASTKVKNTHLKRQIEGLKETNEELCRMLESESICGLSLDSGHGSDTSSLASVEGLSMSNSDHHDSKGSPGGQRGVRKLLRRIKKIINLGKPKEELETTAEEKDPLLPLYVTQDGPLYLLTGKKKEIHLPLLCAQHKLDTERVNTVECHVTEDGRLVNRPSSRGQQGRRSLKNYSGVEHGQELDTERVDAEDRQVTGDVRLVDSPISRGQQGSWTSRYYTGTCSTFPISLTHSSSSVTPVPSVTQYWETEMTVGLKGHEWWRRILYIGVVEEGTLDSNMWACYTPPSWCVMVGWCFTHGCNCTRVWNQGKHVSCVRDTMSDTSGTYTLRYGVVVDVVRGRVGFVDVDGGAVLGKMDVEFKQTIYPMFGVHTYPEDATVEMRLLSGSNITMTEDKLKLIYGCLT